MTSSENISSALLNDPFFLNLKNYLIEASGLAYYTDKDSDLADRISRRLVKVGLYDCASYLQLLKDIEKGEFELDAIFAELTIGETHFFRHNEQFDALRNIIFPQIIERNQTTRRIRIWSAGCSIGAEPYSIAIILKRDFGFRIADWDISILATDINRDFLSRARDGKFDEWAFRSTPEDMKKLCFTKSQNHWVISPEYKEWISFQYHNLVKNPYPSLLNNISSFDLILCRNVMIYFNRELVRKIILQLGECLVENGWLLVGHAEPNIELFRSFQSVNIPGATLYQLGGASIEYSNTQIERPAFDIPETPIPTLPILEPENEQVSLDNQQAETCTTPEQSIDNEIAAIRLLSDKGDWENANHYCERLLQKEKLNPTIHFYHALVLEQLGHHAETEQALRRAIYIDRNFVLAHYYLGLLCQKKWRTQEAVQSFENTQRLLSRLNASHTFSDADGISVTELTELTNMHLQVLQQ